MLLKYHHKSIESTNHRISAWLHHVLKIADCADRDRRLATSFIAYRHRNNHIVLYWVPKVSRLPISYDIHRIADNAIISSHFYAHATSLNLRCAFCDTGSTM